MVGDVFAVAPTTPILGVEFPNGARRCTVQVMSAHAREREREREREAEREREIDRADE